MTALQELLRIKRHRELQAEITLRAQRRQLEEARQPYENALASLDSFQKYALRKEQSLYQDLYQRPVHVRDIYYVLGSVTALHARKDMLKEHIATLEAELEQAEHHFNTARERHQRARHTVEKFIELVQTSTNADLLHRNRLEDIEMEDIASLKRDRSEWRNPEEAAIP